MENTALFFSSCSSRFCRGPKSDWRASPGGLLVNRSKPRRWGRDWQLGPIPSLRRSAPRHSSRPAALSPLKSRPHPIPLFLTKWDAREIPYTRPQDRTLWQLPGVNCSINHPETRNCAFQSITLSTHPLRLFQRIAPTALRDFYPSIPHPPPLWRLSS